MTASAFRRISDSEDTLIRSMMPRTSSADPKPAFRPMAAFERRARLTVKPLTFRIVDVATAN